MTLEFWDDGLGWPDDVLQGERENVGLGIIREIMRSSLSGRLVLENVDADTGRSGALAKLVFKLAPIDPADIQT